MKASQKAIDLIKTFEGLEKNSYRCVAEVWTVGYGHTGDDVYPGMRITESQAEDLLKKDLKRFEDGVNELIEVPITQGIMDSLVSFSFNVGLGALSESTLLRLLNQRKYAEAGDQLLRWDKVDGVPLAGLTRRRKAERSLWYSQRFPT